jgi:hypothetical protein
VEAVIRKEQETRVWVPLQLLVDLLRAVEEKK